MDINLSHDELLMIRVLVDSYHQELKRGEVIPEVSLEEEMQTTEHLLNKLKAALAPKNRSL